MAGEATGDGRRGTGPTSVGRLRPIARRDVRVEGGTRSTTFDVGPIRCERFVAPGSRILGAHAHDTIHACFVLDGSMAEADRRDERLLEPGHGRLSPPGDRHRITVGRRGLECLILHVAEPYARAAGQAPPSGRRFLSADRIAALGRELSRETGAGHPDDVSPLALEALALELLACTSRSPRPDRAPPSWLTRTRERLRDELGSSPTLEELARDAGVSRAHLARTFREQYGRTVGADLRALRIESARRLLLESDLPLGAVAFRAGFCDQSHMTRQVGERLGISPGRLRAIARGEVARGGPALDARDARGDRGARGDAVPSRPMSL